MPLKESKVLPAKVLHDLLQNWSSIENGKTAFSGKHGNISMMCKCALQPVVFENKLKSNTWNKKPHGTAITQAMERLDTKSMFKNKLLTIL